MAARQCGLHRSDLDSCRLICAKYMCDSADPFKPATWNEDCVTGKCRDCPKPSFLFHPRQENDHITVSLRTTKDVNGRRVFNLFNVDKSVPQLAQELEKDIRPITEHIYTAAVAWAKCSDDISQLRAGVDVLTFEDFQRNVELTHVEMPTSLGYGANSMQFALYPIGVKFRSEDVGPIKSGAIVFISPDLKHDHQQVEVFESRYVHAHLLNCKTFQMFTFFSFCGILDVSASLLRNSHEICSFLFFAVCGKSSRQWASKQHTGFEKLTMPLVSSSANTCLTIC